MMCRSKTINVFCCKLHLNFQHFLLYTIRNTLLIHVLLITGNYGPEQRLTETNKIFTLFHVSFFSLTANNHHGICILYKRVRLCGKSIMNETQKNERTKEDN